MVVPTRMISVAEVKKNNKKDNLWMIIHNNVYDVSAFLSEHPGGEDALLEFAGKEATVAFEDVGHSEDAREMMEKYKIGELIVEAKPASGKCNGAEYIPHFVFALAVGLSVGLLIKKLLIK